jgi:hypothetical protein
MARFEGVRSRDDLSSLGLDPIEPAGGIDLKRVGDSARREGVDDQERVVHW